MKDLVGSMDLMAGMLDEDGQPMEALQPKMTFNPVTQRIYQCLQHRVLHPDEPLPELDPLLSRSVRPQEEMLRRVEPLADKLREKFPLVRQDATQRPKGACPYAGTAALSSRSTGSRLWQNSAMAVDTTDDQVVKRSRDDPQDFNVVCRC